MTLKQTDAVPEESLATELGRAIAAARAARKLSMRAVAGEAGISQPFLSQIENGRTMPSLITLYRIANALGLSPAALIPAEPEPSPVRVVRRSEGARVAVSEADNAGVGRIITSGAGRVTVSEYRVEPGQDMGDWFQSDGELVVYVASGSIEVSLQGRGDWRLDEGDAIGYPGAERNVWRVLGDAPATILLVYAPGE